MTFKIVKQTKNIALIYLYRKNMLMNDIEDNRSKIILERYGYSSLKVEDAIRRLSTRLSNCEEFPHEIGLFLGYPPEDVETFICNKGQNCSACKYWKVYCNVEETLIKLAKFDKCMQIYKQLWSQGRNINQLTVCN